MPCYKRVKWWHILIPAIILLEIALACLFFSKEVENYSIIQDRTSKYIVLAALCLGLLLLVLLVGLVFGCRNCGRFSKRGRAAKTSYGYRIDNMVYPFDSSPFTPKRPKKRKAKAKKTGLFSLRSKPFAVSSESFQYEHGSQLGDYSFRNHNTQVSTLKRASIGTDVHYGANRLRNNFSTLPSSLRSKSGMKYLNSLSDDQLRFLYGSPQENTDSHSTSINPSYSESLPDDGQQRDADNNVRPEKTATSTQQHADPPVLVSQGPFVSYNAPDATNLHMIYTEDDYSKVFQKQHEFISVHDGGRPQYSERSATPRSQRSRDRQHSSPSVASGSYSSEVQFLDSSGRQVCYRLIRPKVKGAPVSVIVD